MLALASELDRVARKFGFEKIRQKGNHARWQHRDGRAITISMHFMKF
jgi:predicted RNA binding protein YcfA (HicA-like mRNA interferase family)